jgi:hypothetical protein
MEPRDVSAVLWSLASSGLGAGDDDLVVACMSRASDNLKCVCMCVCVRMYVCDCVHAHAAADPLFTYMPKPLQSI